MSKEWPNRREDPVMWMKNRNTQFSDQFRMISKTFEMLADTMQNDDYNYEYDKGIFMALMVVGQQTGGWIPFWKGEVEQGFLEQIARDEGHPLGKPESPVSDADKMVNEIEDWLKDQ